MNKLNCSLEDSLSKNLNIDEERNIVNILLSMGFRPNMIGYGYIISSIKSILNDPSLLRMGVVKNLYPFIAQLHGTTPVKVDRAIRNAIEVAHEVNTPSWVKMVANYSNGKKKPTNRWFLAVLTEMIRLKMVG